MVCSLSDTFYKLWLMMIAVYEYQAYAMLEANHVGMDKKIKKYLTCILSDISVPTNSVISLHEHFVIQNLWLEFENVCLIHYLAVLVSH